ncbi:MAG TPA: hypothetical protein VLL96_06160, partial [Candidatus Deferrimicrobiaceae bacterium]|nr:hypothetical protein [Candidatus Deferrimicrobiaceae bacterium]
MQQLILKPAMAQPTTTKLAFNIPDINGLFPGFKAGDFAAVFGPQAITSLMSQLCVRAQMPRHLGGFETKVVFIDAANSSSLSTILEAAKLQQLDHDTLNENVVHTR